MKRLVLCVEGRGDVTAVPVLVGNLMAELPAALQGVMFADSKPLEVGNVTQITGTGAAKWVQYLEVAKNRKNLGAVLLVLDGDERLVEKNPFCAVRVARLLAERAKTTGAGQLFSVAVVFLLREYESLLIASYSTLTGRRDKVPIPENVEDSPRGAKEWLRKHRDGGYKEVQDQVPLTREINFGLLRTKGVRCFRRLECGLRELIEAVQAGQHIVSPVPPAGATPGK